ncbi:autotransporter outer membrane beta-barrel domain-containing protein [Snodgrassella sp.]|uniref:autotransporter outer membrane beta-barrel domain-containing protein n=1 Tax=Snodgrassella sp. TaxID=2815304 RepID=UPI00258A8BFA|nr:autotransporter outer membrane beta-barrel domain-containing protein [Snodgrassella sp.]MCO6518115.1 autotransporter outer membrane beta-barrel domain-containing protein [Snodgrassella sp.]
MNTIYKSKWNESTCTWVACSELVRGKTKNNCIKIAAAIILALASINSYAACDPTEDNPPSINATSKDTCQLTEPAYTNISASGANLQGDSINARGKASGANKTIRLIKNSELIAGDVTTQNDSSDERAQALSINGSTATVNNLTAINKGSTATIIETKNNANLTVNDNLLIKDLAANQTGSNYSINNANSIIKVAGEINITNQDSSTSDETQGGIGSIKNDGGIITADSIYIKQKSKNYAISQLDDEDSDQETSIKIKTDLNIIATNQHSDNSVININAGNIDVGGKTWITTNYNSMQYANAASAINIQNGQYRAQGDVNITIKDNEGNYSNKANGILLGKNATFTNGGTAKVNEGGNTVIATNTDSEEATVNNTGTIKSNDNVNSIAHNSNGTLTINNEGTIEGIISNKTQGTIKLTNNGQISHGIKNPSGIIDINNNNTISGAIINSANDEANKPTIHININNTKNLSGNIRNEGTGIIKITNTGTVSGDITNAGDRVIDVIDIVGSTKIRNNIEIINNGNLSNIINQGKGDIEIINNGDLSNIINQGKGNIHLTNKGQNTTVVDKEIKNTDTGNITIENQQGATLPHTFLNQSTHNDSFIEINNSGKIDGDFTNEGSRILVINKETGIIKNNITGNADLPESDISVMGSHISITNHGQLDSTINIKRGGFIFENKGKSQINLTNYSGAPILLMNSGTLTGSVENSVENDSVGEFIIFKNYPTGQFTGSLNNKQNGKIEAKNEGIFTGTTQNEPKGLLNLNNTGTWTNTGNSTLTKLINQGTIKFNEITPADAGNTSKYNSITVYGKYTGDTTTHIDNINKDNAKSKIQVTTLWNQDDSGATNYINITGDVTGATWVNGIIYGNINKPEENEVDSQSVIRVHGTIDSRSGFKGSAKVRSSASEAQLKRIEHEDGKTDFVWTLFAEPKPDPVKPAPIDPIEPPPIDPIEPAPTEPVKPINPVPPKRVPIYAEPVSGYVQMPTANMELGFTTIGTLHERRSENQTNNINGANNTALGDTQQQTWGRVVVKHLDKDGKKRLDTAGSQSVLQIGHDFIIDENDKTGARRHIGGYVSYGHNENDFRDQYRAENGYIVDDHYTGKGRTDAVSVGGYGTFYGNNGGYVDLVSQVTYLRNKYNARSNESVHQNGWGAALSAEAGKSFIVYGNNWFVEPQAQLVYQYLSLDDFNDRYRHIDQHNPSALRGRIGMRFGYNGDTTDNLPPSSFYGIANIWHDFVNPKSVDIGRDTLKEEYAKTWGEIGAGIQWSITRQSDFYGDVRYEKNFGSDKRKGFKGTLGYKYTWL